MSENMMVLLIHVLLGAGFIVLGIYLICSKREKPMHFWANAKIAPIPKENVGAYNRALGKLWIFFGVGLILLGLPLLGKDDAVTILFAVLGVPLITILLIVLYIFKIENKYREK